MKIGNIVKLFILIGFSIIGKAFRLNLEKNLKGTKIKILTVKASFL